MRQPFPDGFRKERQQRLRHIARIAAVVEDECSRRTVGTRLRPAFPERDASFRRARIRFNPDDSHDGNIITNSKIVVKIFDIDIFI